MNKIWTFGITCALLLVSTAFATSGGSDLPTTHAWGKIVLRTKLVPAKADSRKEERRLERALQRRWKKLVSRHNVKWGREVGKHGFTSQPFTKGREFEFRRFEFEYRVTNLTANYPRLEATLRAISNVKTKRFREGKIKFRRKIQIYSAPAS